ncbi:MAG: hypothetical protein JST82_11305 [Bacteroidetes bacterium]|nr:hypothetical protein [Bacteroidota bacterium]
MPTTVQIVDSLSCIRVVTNGVPLEIHKKAVKTIDVLHNDTVRIDIGEGALRHVYIRFAEVTVPGGLANVNILRDTIKGMLDADDASGATAGNQVSEIGILNNIKDAQNAANGLLTNIRDVETSQSNALVTIKDGQATQNNLLNDVKAGQATQSNLLTNVRDNLAGMQNTLNNEQNLLQAMNTLLTDIRTYLNPANQQALTDPSIIDESVPMVIYYGYALPGARLQDPAWAIKRVTKSDNVIEYYWADGNQNMNQIWNDRYNLNYLPLNNGQAG